MNIIEAEARLVELEQMDIAAAAAEYDRLGMEAFASLKPSQRLCEELECYYARCREKQARRFAWVAANPKPAAPSVGDTEYGEYQKRTIDEGHRHDAAAKGNVYESVVNRWKWNEAGNAAIAAHERKMAEYYERMEKEI